MEEICPCDHIISEDGWVKEDVKEIEQLIGQSFTILMPYGEMSRDVIRQ